MLNKKVQVLSETIKKLLHCHADENLSKILAKAHAADIAYVLGQLDVVSQAHVFSLLKNSEQGAKVLAEMEMTLVTPLLENLGGQKASEILSYVSPDDAADILENLPGELSSTILLSLKKEEAEEVEGLIRYRPDTAGGIMSPDFFALHEELTVEQAIQKIQQSRDVETMFYVYVVNSQGHLMGVLSLKKLILNGPKIILKEVMDKDPIRVRLDEDQEEVARTVSRYNYLSVPVVDDANKLVGVITVDDIIDVIKEEATEDLLLMAGADKGAMVPAPLWITLKKRMPWYLVTLLGGLIASEVIARFYSSISKVSLLAGFIPLVLSMGGNIGTQSMAIVVSSLSVGRLSAPKIFSVMFKEFRLAVILGLVYGLVLAAFTHFRYGVPSFLPLAIGSALALSMVISVCLGSSLPLLFQKLGLDPAIASGPFVTTLVNIFCMWTYFTLATQFIIVRPGFS
ncbi:MAG: magnesium transporter [Deltaproteobacteria bacterium RIFCSPLOWO2_12_FULL_44_12]|nr:MAG: magnesium transporter [Deltaproteobacteria bacterium RIFCSPHIGHO2_01_FULL_43_49]OGQ15618.1 MAG: magnesium transporter [Deltaproteobacteria bacterium RIFCSPHIGHO2_02_FULL_44_53]OGQ28322.1 MAG: magnesium transporter [Deltaproteobacteria bacterium RIFCSPHIGHO2_12_FULL_44_21]OGQ31909.1 MAG: magnesium transporter [Deltaproteobacteria bacterium RIFCSPLOWO2_01_FULL_45_74]OGQ43525.1 MAG: magnesium transporter [Deltaproteobacteria bacterium RIFCSPLOWO2_02_FULL_44_34]OGQ71172.1 MAG: magnesium tr